MADGNHAANPTVSPIDIKMTPPGLPVAGVGVALIVFALVSTGGDVKADQRVAYVVVAIGALFLLGGALLLARQSLAVQQRDEDAAIGSATNLQRAVSQLGKNFDI